MALALPTQLCSPHARPNPLALVFSGDPYTYQGFIDYYGEDAPEMWEAAEPYKP